MGEAAASPAPPPYPGPSAQGLKPSAWSLKAPFTPLHSMCLLLEPGTVSTVAGRRATLLVNVLGVGSTTALSLVVWTVSWECPDHQEHLTGEAEGWVQAGHGSGGDGCSRPAGESSWSWGPSSWRPLLAPLGDDETTLSGLVLWGRGTWSKDARASRKDPFIGVTRSTHQSMIK